MNVGSVFITGASRGIGLEMVRQLIRLPKPPKHVFASYRKSDDSQALEAIRDSSKECQVNMIEMDVLIPKEVEAARKIVGDTVGENGLNLLINNAGVLKLEHFPDITSDTMLYHFKTNTLGPITVMKEMLPLLQKAADRQNSGLGVSRAAVLNMSDSTGSISKMDEPKPSEWLGVLGYWTSKAALNMAMRVITQEIKNSGILVVLMCPGWVKTDIGAAGALIEASESVSTIFNTCTLLNETHQGAFVDRFGKCIPF